MLNKLKDKCRVCEKQFDKNNKTMLSEWTVVVREAEEKVHLYCPACWKKAQNIVKDISNNNVDKKEKTIPKHTESR